MASLVPASYGLDEQNSAALSSYAEPMSVSDVHHNEMEGAQKMRILSREIDRAVP